MQSSPTLPPRAVHAAHQVGCRCPLAEAMRIDIRSLYGAENGGGQTAQLSQLAFSAVERWGQRPINGRTVASAWAIMRDQITTSSLTWKARLRSAYLCRAAKGSRSFRPHHPKILQSRSGMDGSDMLDLLPPDGS